MSALGRSAPDFPEMSWEERETLAAQMRRLADKLDPPAVPKPRHAHVQITYVTHDGITYVRNHALGELESWSSPISSESGRGHAGVLTVSFGRITVAP